MQMPIIRRPNLQGQITIPKEYLDKLGLAYTNYFRIQLKDNTIVLAPMTVEPTFTKEEKRKLQMLFNDPKNRGQVYPSSKEALGALRKRLKKE